MILLSYLLSSVASYSLYGFNFHFSEKKFLENFRECIPIDFSGKYFLFNPEIVE